jgi:hypothetical protein
MVHSIAGLSWATETTRQVAASIRGHAPRRALNAEQAARLARLRRS